VGIAADFPARPSSAARRRPAAAHDVSPRAPGEPADPADVARLFELLPY
jgi:hypothetical protein